MDWIVALAIAVGGGVVSGIVSATANRINISWLQRGLKALETRFNSHLEHHAEGKFQ